MLKQRFQLPLKTLKRRAMSPKTQGPTEDILYSTKFSRVYNLAYFV